MGDRVTAEARALRRNATPAEQVLWACLRGHRLGVKFRRQHPLGGYVVDFYCAAARVVVEADGAPHFQLDEEQRRHEERRSAAMREMRIVVLRLENDEIMTDPERALWRIKSLLAQRLHWPDPRTPPSYAPRARRLSKEEAWARKHYPPGATSPDPMRCAPGIDAWCGTKHIPIRRDGV